MCNSKEQLQEVYSQENCMAGDKLISATHSISSTQPDVRSHNDSDVELIAYYYEQLNRHRSDEWSACLHATITQLRHS
jgi:hypothetical protein